MSLIIMLMNINKPYWKNKDYFHLMNKCKIKIDGFIQLNTKINTYIIKIIII